MLRLLDQQRFAEAEEQIRRLAAASPNDGPLHALHAVCLAELEHLPQAVDAARRAVDIAPESAYCVWALAIVRLACHEFRKARVLAAKAVRLNPGDADYLLVLARAEAGLANWDAALAALEKGLTVDSDHRACRMLRALILERRGQTTEASDEFLEAITRDPTDAMAHAGRGWVALHDEPGSGKAIRHFREALQHDSTSEWAREGLIAALKARNPIYRLMLRYFLAMRAHSRRSQMLIIVGAMAAFSFLRRTVTDHPEWAPVIYPLLGIYMAVLVLSWIAEPVFDLLLRLDRNGRTALTRERIEASNWMLADIVVAVLLGVLAFLTGAEAVAFAAMIFGFLMLPLAGTFQCNAGWPRTTMASLTALIGLLGAGVLIGPEEVARMLFVAGLGATIISTWVNRWLASVTPARR